MGVDASGGRLMYAVFDVTTGALVSTGTVVADPLPAHLASVLLPDDVVLGSTHDWDASARAAVPLVVGAVAQSVADFMRRVGFEREAYLNRLRRDPTTSLDLGAQLDTLSAWLTRVPMIDPADPLAQLGVTVLADLFEAANLLPEGRAAFALALFAP